MKFIPSGPRLLVELDEVEKEISLIHGITLTVPDVAQQKPNTGTVRGLGTQPNHTFQYAVGDRVILPQFGGYNLKLDRKEYRVIMEDEVIGKLVD